MKSILVSGSSEISATCPKSMWSFTCNRVASPYVSEQSWVRKKFLKNQQSHMLELRFYYWKDPMGSLGHHHLREGMIQETMLNDSVEWQPVLPDSQSSALPYFLTSGHHWAPPRFLTNEGKPQISLPPLGRKWFLLCIAAMGSEDVKKQRGKK